MMLGKYADWKSGRIKIFFAILPLTDKSPFNTGIPRNPNVVAHENAVDKSTDIIYIYTRHNLLPLF
jgi:hypothetical protein